MRWPPPSGEAQTAFGNPAVLIEKYIEKPRHIEVQVFGDGTRAVHLFERDCSLQRRHQKVIEEAPAPGMTPEMRAAMGAGRRACRRGDRLFRGRDHRVHRRRVGRAAVDRFWFMEMNTRLQVEHPVTEAITGVDLVEWQLRVASQARPAAAHRTRFAPHRPRLRGAALCRGRARRLPARDRAAGASGLSAAARAETGVRSGDVISPWYDPMIAKIIVHGPTRAAALRSLTGALDQTEVAGTVTNLAFLEALSRHEGFAAGRCRYRADRPRSGAIGGCGGALGRGEGAGSCLCAWA
jgi:3-methylcrotonyl-CoA carboxylase alpha subunit